MKRFIPLIIVLLLGAALAVVLDDFVRQAVVEPLLFLLWVMGVLVQSLPQFVFWVLFVLAALIILAKSLDAKLMWPHRDDRRQYSNVTRGVVASWQRQLQRAETQPYFRWQLARSLAILSREVLTPTDPFNPDEKQPLAEAIASLPPEIAAYFQVKDFQQTAVISPWYRQKLARNEATLDFDPEKLIEFLEKETGWEK